MEHRLAGEEAADGDPVEAAAQHAVVHRPSLDAVGPAELVQLRYFGGLTIPETAAFLEIAPRTADAWWAYARGWLATELQKS